MVIPTKRSLIRERGLVGKVHQIPDFYVKKIGQGFEGRCLGVGLSGEDVVQCGAGYFISGPLDPKIIGGGVPLLSNQGIDAFAEFL